MMKTIFWISMPWDVTYWCSGESTEDALTYGYFGA